MAVTLIIAAVVGVVALIVGLVSWIGALIRVWQHADWTTEKKALWFLVIFIAGILGAAVYYFVTGRKSWGIASVVALVAIPVIYFVAIGSFFAATGLQEVPRY